MNISEKLSFFGIRYALLAFWLSGIIVLVEIFSNLPKEKTQRFFFLQIVMCAAMIFLAGRFWEKYIIMVLPSLFILLGHSMKPPNKILAYSIICLFYVLNIVGFYILPL